MRTAARTLTVVVALAGATACQKAPQGGAFTPSPEGSYRYRDPTDQAATVVTSRSNGRAIADPRRGSFTPSAPGTYGYVSPK